MMEPKHKLLVIRKAELVGVSRVAVYCVLRPLPEADLAFMRMLDELHLEYPFAGARMRCDMLNAGALA